MSDDENDVKSGAVAGSPAPLFENLAEDERAFEDTNPFKAPRRVGGSRKGIPNRRTEDSKRYYSALGFRDPLAFLGHLITIQPDELAREMRMTLADALDMQRKAAVDLMPYLHSKQPARVELGEGEAIPMLVIGRAERQAAQAQVAAGAISIDGDWPDEENQGFSEAAPSPSHEQPSHEQAKSEE